MHQSSIEVYGDTETCDSNVEFPTRFNPHLKMTIGFGWRDEIGVVNGALHEIVEASYVLMRLSYEPFCNVGGDSLGRFVFVMNHEQFTTAIDNASLLVQTAIPAIVKAWRKTRRQK